MLEADGATTSLSQLRSALMYAPIGVLVVAHDNPIILFANAAIETMLGYPAQGLEGRRLDVLLPATVQGHHQDLMAGFFSAPRQRMMGSGRDLYARHFSGQSVPVEIALSPMELNGDSCAIAFVSDISERRQAQRRLEHIFSAMPQGVLLVDTQGTVVLTNPSLDEQFGYAAGELRGYPMETMLPERFRIGHAQYLKSYIANPVQRKMGMGRDLTGLHKSGAEFPVEIALSGVDMGEQRLLMAVVSDISLRKKAENALRQTNAQLEEFTYVASHDLRSPLRGIADLVTWIQEDLPAEALQPGVVQNFERISIRIARCERMIDDLLGYAHAGEYDRHLDLVDLKTLVDDILMDLNVPQEIAVEVLAAIAPFRAPLTPITLSLRNLIGNAIKHHGEGPGVIRVRANDEGRFVVITIEDDGQGVPEGAEERIFKLFHRASATTEGHGVGLAVTRRMINAHGGSIVVQRSADLGGACFRIHWPRILLKEVGDE